MSAAAGPGEPTASELSQAELPPASEGRQERHPEIIVNHRQVRDVAEDAWNALLASEYGRGVLRYGESLVYVPHQTAPAGDPVHIQSLDQDLLRALLNRAASWLRVVGKAGQARAAGLPADVTRDMIALPHATVPAMSGLTRLPPMRPDGSVATEAGLDRNGGLLHIADPAVLAALTSLPQVPNSADVENALRLLEKELLADFPFARRSDRAHALAALLQPFVRHLISGPTPLHLIEAPSPGTGKGLLATVLHLIAVGSDAVPTPLPTSEAEVRKKILSALMIAPPAVLLDNIGHVLDSASLAAVLTTTLWSDRVLGQSKTITAPNRTLWLATGNNPVLSREMARRSVRIRLDSKVERPWLRDGFQHEDLPGWVRAQRPALIVAVLTMLRSWAQAGSPKGTVRLGSFEAWASVIGGVLEHVGVEGFLADRLDDHEIADPEEEDWAAFVPVWAEAFGEKAVSSRQLLELATRSEAFQFDARTPLDSGTKSRFSGALTQRRDRRYGAWRIAIRRDARRKVNLYALAA